MQQLAGADENERRWHGKRQKKGEDGGADGDDDGKAIEGNDNVSHPNQQSTNNGGKRIKRTSWEGAGGRQVAKPPEAMVSAVKRIAVQQEP